MQDIDEDQIEFSDLITAAQAAEFMGIKVRSVYEYRRTGRVKGVYFGRALLISKKSIQEWLAKKRDYKTESPR